MPLWQEERFMIFQCGGIFAILLAMLSATGALDTTSDGMDIKKIIEPTSIGLATYVKDNFGLFVEKYNEQADDKTLNASSIEFEKEIYVVDSDYYAYYLDFDEENGYSLFGNDYSLLSFSADGDLPYVRECCF